MSERPKKAPLRKILEYSNPKRKSETKRVLLECGHHQWISRNAYPQRTRCYTCLRAAREIWEAENTCPHNILIVEGRVCEHCRITYLESEKNRLRDAMRFNARCPRSEGEEPSYSENCLNCDWNGSDLCVVDLTDLPDPEAS